MMASQNAVPTLQPERDELPTTCAGCGSRALMRQPGTGGEHFGTLSCFRCGAVAAYVLEPPPPIGSSRPARVPKDALPPEPKTIMLYEAVGFERTDDCTDACGPATGHSPDAHHTAGRLHALAEVSERGDALVRTGPLAVDLAARQVWVDGRPIALVGRGLDVVLALASVAPHALSWGEIIARVWADHAPESRDRRGPFHWLSVVVVRVRQRLGPSAAPLLVTVPYFGYRLEMVAYAGPEQLAPKLAESPIAFAWSRAWPACRECGTTERGHKAHGLCWRCDNRRRERKNRPVGRPRKDVTT